MAGISTILVIAATQMELNNCQKRDCVTFCVTGIGPAATALSLAQAIAKCKPDVVIQLGIAGAISKDIPLVETVYVETDQYGDMGVWRDNHFTSFDTTIYKSDFSLDSQLRKVCGVTVSTACSPFALRNGADVESMEGAPFYQTASAFKVPALQLRGISNYMDTPRSQWQIASALENLATTLDTIIDKLLSDR